MSKATTMFISAANVADYNTSHYIHLPIFQDGMLDELRRDCTILDRIKAVPATGQPSRYWEQMKLPQNTAFVDVRGGGEGFTGYSKNEVDEDYGRVEKSLYLKCQVGRVKFTLFDQELVKQQGEAVAVNLLKKDLDDMMVQFYRKKNDAIWNGTATTVEDSSTKEYCGLLTQIGAAAATITAEDTTTRIAQVIRTEIAKQVADKDWDKKVTAIYANPVTIDILEQELDKDSPNYRMNNQIEVVPGVTCTAIQTQAGRLPIIPDAFIPVASSGGKDTHHFVLMNENMVERHYLTTPEPRVFKMTQNEDLLDDYLAIAFDGIVLKGKSAFIVDKEVNTAS